MSEHLTRSSARDDAGSVGQNDWLVEENHQRYLVDASSVDQSWRDLFQSPEFSAPTPLRPIAPEYPLGVPPNAIASTNGSAHAEASQTIAAAPAGTVPLNGAVHAVAAPSVTAPSVTAPADASSVSVSPPAPASPASAGTAAPATAPLLVTEQAGNGDAPVALRGAPALLAKNMTASLGVPTATSVHPLPATVLEVNRRILNEQLARTSSRKLSFTHLIAYAIVRGIETVPVLNSHYEADADGAGNPGVVHHRHVGLGLAIDLERRDGSRSLVVPVLRDADTLTFAEFVDRYEEIVQRARENHLSVDDFAGTTVTITNPGTLGTTQSVPRLMEGQGAIIGVGAIDYPVEFAATDPDALVALGVGKVLTLTSTYDHRIIQGAESGLYLRRVHELLVGDHGFYEEIFASLGVAASPAHFGRDHPNGLGTSAFAPPDGRIGALVDRYRSAGHLASSLDPLAPEPPAEPPELDPAACGLSVFDLDRRFSLSGLGGLEKKSDATLSELLAMLRGYYTGTIGAEFMYAETAEERAFFLDALERPVAVPDRATQLWILEALQRAESFERFLHARYVGQRRFSLEGGEATIVFLNAALEAAVQSEVREAALGMAHRGRLNVLATILGKRLELILAEFEGNLDPASVEGSGDVKYHKGGYGTWTSRSGSEIAVTMTSNPSHLEAVDPVIVGRARGRQDTVGDTERRTVLPILIHGDASMAGQGVVAETLNLSLVDGYRTGGSVHLVINNQLGFTTSPSDGRATRYASDVAKAVSAPVLHVNGDDPEAVARCAELAIAYRTTFQKDVVVDLVCYRLHGHNEGDDPSYTQPLIYETIAHHLSVRSIYTDLLLARGSVTTEEIEAVLASITAELTEALAATRAKPAPAIEHAPPSRLSEVPPLSGADSVEPAVLDALAEHLHHAPAGFTVHPKLERQLSQRIEQYRSGEVDWALGEALAFATLLVEGTPIRLVGQDTRRGTFSQRHAVLVDYQTAAEHTPLAHVGELGLVSGDVAPFEIHDSVLSEYAGLGFEYGYTLGAPATLDLWEAQFGDFANGAQIIVDNFIAAAEEKWGQLSGVVLLLPHGYEGQGPEHSSARLERYLQLATGDNMTVVQPTTAGQYFHLLRAQAHQLPRRPLVVITPKSLLRAPRSRTPVVELASGHFAPVLDDARLGPEAASGVTTLRLCSGRISADLFERSGAVASTSGTAPVPVVRLEQLAPWPRAALSQVLARYPALSEIIFVQDEPENMGPWSYVAPRLTDLVGDRVGIRHVSRGPAGSPATGSHLIHELELEALLEAAIGPPPRAAR